MSIRDGEENQRRGLSGRRRMVAGVVGLAVVLGGGAYLVTDRIAGQDTSTAKGTPDVVAPVVPVTPDAPGMSADQDGTGPVPSPTTSATAGVSTPAPARKPTARASSARPSSTGNTSAEQRKEIDAARAAAAADGYPLKRAVTPTGNTVAPAAISTATQNTAEGTIRISTVLG